ncbi:MAG: hypothetical protein LBJ74_04765 [Heliobacteriaceae bacterium]|nr:hypothetical protein [Heliobacteriaceae bacterium]
MTYKKLNNIRHCEPDGLTSVRAKQSRILRLPLSGLPRSANETFAPLAMTKEHTRHCEENRRFDEAIQKNHEQAKLHLYII